MALEALSTNELLNFIIYDTICATPFSCNGSSDSSNLLSDTKEQILGNANAFGAGGRVSSPQSILQRSQSQPLDKHPPPPTKQGKNLAVQGRKKRRRKPRVCKNKEEAETQRMTHIAVERNRRKQMNEHLSVLRSLMPESYVQRGDQASIVGGAIEFVKELEHLLQCLEAQKLQILEQEIAKSNMKEEISTNTTRTTSMNSKFPPPQFPPSSPPQAPPFSQFFAYPQYTCSQIPSKYTSKSKQAIADIEVTLIETHANLRILSRKCARQLSQLVAGFQSHHLSILHLNVTTLEPLVLYSISAKVEEGCRLTTVEDIAGAVHHMLRIIEEEALLC
ncbi:Myc-type, basic helix-loop-helix (bHLH) domain [Dillenia turbinata]|uniref:Myc-type, basic helix-loop-helix (BHLH) domain n=1 Tax=Dillenia turbinata TaxID=194707 RepID=A0AAN8WJ03_9MAGN